MPNDTKGVKMIYASSKKNPQSIYYNGNFNERIQMRRQTASPNHGNILSFNEGNELGQLDFYTSSGYNSAKVRPPDHGRYATQGFMQDNKDWRNVECTTYVKVNDAPDGSVIWFLARTGNDRYQSGDCESCGYEGRLYVDGRVGVNKKFYTGALFLRPRDNVTDDIEDRWVGLKFIVYNTSDGNVVTEIWIDENNNNSWNQAYTSTDPGGFGNAGEHCNADEGERITWGGPIVSLYWSVEDLEKSVEFQKISIREIDKGEDFGNENDSDIDDDDDDSDDGNNTSGSGGMVDKYGVRSRYATGKIRYDPDENFRDDGKRWDFDVGADEFVSCELRGYFKCSSDPNDDVAGKMGGGQHHDGSEPKCYVLDIGTDGSNIRLRYEEDHPSTPELDGSAGDGSGNGKGLVGAYVGYCFVKRNLSNGNVLLQIWQDKGNNEGEGDEDSGPANEWELVGSWEDSELQWQDPPSDHAETIRIDNDAGHNLEAKWIALHEILDSDSEDPSQGGSDNGTGGSGGGDDSGGTGDGTGGTGSGPSTPPAPPAPPREVYQTAYLELMWNINYISGDPCNVNAPPEGFPPQQVISVTGTDAYINIGRDLMTGGWFINKNSVLIGKKIRQLDIVGKKEGSPTGLIRIRIYDKTNTVVQEFDNTRDASTFTANDETYEFDCLSPNRVLQEGDRISIDFWGSGIVVDTVNYLRIKIADKDEADSTATCLFISDDNRNIEVTEPLDLAGSIYI